MRIQLICRKGEVMDLGERSFQSQEIAREHAIKRYTEKRGTVSISVQDRNSAYLRLVNTLLSEDLEREAAVTQARQFWDTKCPHLIQHPYPSE